ncbi:MAG: hypothetical protein C4297_11020 [Gemmataceae bacterium]
MQATWQGARACIERATALEPDRQEIHVLHGILAFLTGQFDVAEKHYRELLSLAPEDPVARDRLALALIEQAGTDKHKRALELAQVNARLYPGSAGTLSTLGRIYHRLGRLDDAERTLRTALASGRAGPDTYYFLARVLADRGQQDEALELTRQALRLPVTDFLYRTHAQSWLEEVQRQRGAPVKEGRP